MESLDSILKGKEPSAVVEQPKAEATPEPVAETPTESAEQKAARERDEKGRFKAKAEGETPAQPETPKAAVQPKVETKPAPTADQKAKATDDTDAEPLDPKAKAYYAKAKDEQRKRQALEQELARLRAQQPQQQPRQIPNPQENPAEFVNHVQSQAADAQWETILNTSEISAVDKFGDEKVDEAKAWFLQQRESNPALEYALRQQRHPYRWVVEQFQHAQLLNEIGTDPNAWREQQRAAIRAELEAEQAQKPQVPARPAAPVPPPSLANANSAAGSISTKTVYEGPTPLKNLFRR